MSDPANLLHHQTPSVGPLPPAEVSLFRYIAPQCRTYSEEELGSKASILLRTRHNGDCKSSTWSGETLKVYNVSQLSENRSSVERIFAIQLYFIHRGGIS